MSKEDREREEAEAAAAEQPEHDEGDDDAEDAAGEDADDEDAEDADDEDADDEDADDEDDAPPPSIGPVSQPAPMPPPPRSEHGQGAASTHAHGHHAPDRKEYARVFIVLFVLTGLEVGIAYMEKIIGKTPLVVALIGLALSKAVCVALFYMHLKHESKTMKWTVGLPVLFPALYAFILIAEGAYRALWGT